MGIDGSHLGVRSRGCNGEVELEDEPPLYEGEESEGGGVLALVSTILLFLLVAVMLLAMVAGFVSHVLAELFAVGWNAVSA